MGALCPAATAVMFESPTEQLRGMRSDRVDWIEQFHGVKIEGSRDPAKIMHDYPIERIKETTFPYDDHCAVMTHPFKGVVIPEDDPILVDIKRVIRRPQYVQDMVAAFIESFFSGGTYAGNFPNTHFKTDQNHSVTLALRSTRFSVN